MANYIDAVPTFGVRLRGLFEEAWTRARRRRLLLAVAVGGAAAAVALVIGPPGSDGPRPASTAHASARAIDAAAPRRVAADGNVPVTFTAHRDTGVVGRSGHGYSVSAVAIAPAVACVNNRDVSAPDGIAAGSRVTLTLAVRRGEGGDLGWCPGSYRGTIAYMEDFRCPPKGRCHIPAGFPHRRAVVAHFAFRVPARSERSAKFVRKLKG